MKEFNTFLKEEFGSKIDYNASHQKQQELEILMRSFFKTHGNPYNLEGTVDNTLEKYDYNPEQCVFKFIITDRKNNVPGQRIDSTLKEFLSFLSSKTGNNKFERMQIKHSLTQEKQDCSYVNILVSDFLNPDDLVIADTPRVERDPVNIKFWTHVGVDTLTAKKLDTFMKNSNITIKRLENSIPGSSSVKEHFKNILKTSFTSKEIIDEILCLLLPTVNKNDFTFSLRDVINKFNTSEVGSFVGFFREFEAGPYFAIKADENNFIFRDKEKAYLVDVNTQLKVETNIKEYNTLLDKTQTKLGIK